MNNFIFLKIEVVSIVKSTLLITSLGNITTTIFLLRNIQWIDLINRYYQRKDNKDRFYVKMHQNYENY